MISENIRTSDCYLIVPKDKEKPILSTDSAKDVSIYLWGRVLKDYVIYKAVRLQSADVFEIRDELESR
jgi:hypothetical protein